jgi:hypothetical protein
VNWTVAARNLLPMIPALAILVSMPGKNAEGKAKRKIPLLATAKSLLPEKPFVTAAILGLALALLATWADSDWANRVRRAANELTAEFKNAGKQVSFVGHWGFQYYMELAGATALDFSHAVIAPNTVTILPWNSSNTSPNHFRDAYWRYVDENHIIAKPEYAKFDPNNGKRLDPPPQAWEWTIEEHRKERTTSGIYLMDQVDSAGFYSHVIGTIPLALSTETPDRYYVMTPLPPGVQPK